MSRDFEGIDYPAIYNHILRGFKQYEYCLEETTLQDGDLEIEKKKLIASLPFKSDIYLPTSKIKLEDQICGLKRVQDLQSMKNLAATYERFEVLKRLLRGMGKRRIFVIGNGPSIKKMDLSLLKNEITIGFNGIFLHEWFVPTIYIVEDHLVAEDRMSEIHSYVCPVKLFPSYLGYCLQAQDNTIFLNHLSRISYPVDTDFSADAGRISYTGGTVTYTGLQVAASLGFEEIILIGVDASYQVHNVDRTEDYGTGVLTSKSDDTNHFDPRYFGKGYRWHDPNVHTMLQAYRKARNWGIGNDVRIVNATIGGQLEVFPRTDFHQLFPSLLVHPKVAILDFTSVNRVSATGIVKKNLLADWPKSSLFHTYCDEKGRLIAFQNIQHDLYAEKSDHQSVWPAFRSLIEFDPAVLYLRPTLDRIPMTILQVVAAITLRKPWLVHYMDDWLEKARKTRQAELAESYTVVMYYLFSGAYSVLSICPKMSTYLRERFKLPSDRVHSIHNFLQPGISHQLPVPLKNSRRKIIRYFGGLEPDMGLNTLVKVAQQIEAFNLAQDRFELVYEITTSKSYIDKHSNKFSGLECVTFKVQNEDYNEYLIQLYHSDLNLICYNFNEESVSYVRYSLANKLPELLSVNVPFLAIGSPDIGTIELLSETRYPLLLTDPDFDIREVLRFVLEPKDSDLQAYHSAVLALKDECSEEKNKYALYNLFRKAAITNPIQSNREIRWRDIVIHNITAIYTSAQNHTTVTQDLDLMIKILMLESSVVDEAFDRVRQHGLSWSVREEHKDLTRLVKSSKCIGEGDRTLQARCLAFLICGFGIDRYKTVNDHVRDWMRGLSLTG